MGNSKLIGVFYQGKNQFVGKNPEAGIEVYGKTREEALEKLLEATRLHQEEKSS